LQAENALRPAAVGATGQKEVHTEIRSDFIRWWPDEPEFHAERAFLEEVEALASYLNQTCFTGIHRWEFMYAVYPPGAHYERHVDDFKNKNARKFSVVTYLNDAWQHGQGGELVLYDVAGRPSETVDPLFGRTVIFSSPLVEHEVLPALADRWSVTGWLR
jgi:SM-20-related protein